MNLEDRQLLERWLTLIARFREHDWIDEGEAAALRSQALEAVG